MILIETKSEMHERARAWKRSGKRVALVPTMGALHAGHLALVERAAGEADIVVVSIFVNPAQFGPSEDFSVYPRNVASDMQTLEEQGVASCVFAPGPEEVYPEWPNRTWVQVEGMDSTLCGARREGHFRGVVTVVSRLFAMIQPDVAVFGMKDAQQFFILRRLCEDMGFATGMVGVPTVREADGLAMSSRNRYLSEEERQQAPLLYTAVQAARQLIRRGERRIDKVEEAMRQELAGTSVEYASVVDTGTMQLVDVLRPGMEVLAAVAVHFGRARLIDNVVVSVPDNSEVRV